MNIPLNIDWQQILLHWFNLAILIAGLYVLLYKPIKKFINEREEHFRQMEEETQNALESAKKSEAEIKSRLDTLEDEIAETRKKALHQLEADKAMELKETNAECSRLIVEARKNAEREKMRIIDGAKDEVANLAINAIDKILAVSGRDALNQFLADNRGESDGD